MNISSSSYFQQSQQLSVKATQLHQEHVQQSNDSAVKRAESNTVHNQQNIVQTFQQMNSRGSAIDMYV